MKHVILSAAIIAPLLAGCGGNPVEKAVNDVCACKDAECAEKTMTALEGLEAEAKKLPAAKRKELDQKAEECAKKALLGG
jgi:hypothetical protein